MDIKVEGNKLIITVDCSPEAQRSSPPSKSGKNKLLASTGGFVPVVGLDGIKIGLNVTAPLC